MRPSPAGFITRSACLVIKAADTRFSSSCPMSSARASSVNGRAGAKAAAGMDQAPGGGPETDQRADCPAADPGGRFVVNPPQPAISGRLHLVHAGDGGAGRGESGRDADAERPAGPEDQDTPA